MRVDLALEVSPVKQYNDATGKPLAKNYLVTRFGDASRPVRLRQRQCHYWVIELRDESRAIVRPFVAFAVPTIV